MKHITKSEDTRRDEFLSQQCRDAGCLCRGDRSRHVWAVAEMALRAAERSERAIRNLVVDAERAVFAAQQALVATRARLAPRVAAVEQAHNALDALRADAEAAS